MATFLDRLCWFVMNQKVKIFTTWVLCVFVSTAVDAQSAGQDFSAISGFTEPYRSIEIAAAEMGTIAQIEVVEGQQIEAGAILARLNESVHEASLGMAKEKLEAKGRLHSAQAELRMQQERFEKLVGLHQRSNASQIEVDRAKSQLDVAKASVEAVEDDFRIANFEYQRAAAQLELRRIRSPIDGVVTRIHKDSGEFVSASDPVVLSVVQLDPLKAIFSVPQHAARQFSSGHQVDVHIGTNKAVAVGTVEFVSPTTDAQSGTCRVTVRIENSSGQWQSGDVCVLPTTGLQNSGPMNARTQRSSEDFEFRLINNAKDKK